MFKKVFLIFGLLLFLFSGKTLAFKDETFVTFANPIRGHEGWQHSKQDPLELPMYQYQEATHSAYPITWLLRYDAVKDATISAYFHNLVETDNTQTLGAFLEITPSLAFAADVTYPDGTTFFNPHRIFLSGYSQSDRISLIDTYMSAFFSRYGFYPKSVSAWHLDSYSLQYLQTKYSVLTAMNCDDQYTTDHYRLWGGYLGSPYFPDKNNSLIPASSFANRINLAMVRWAQRDLYNFYGYRSESSYSVQVNDYLSMGQNTLYFERLLALYGQKNFNEFTYLNIGLENDYDLVSYKNEIRKEYQVLKNSQDKYNLRFISLSDFGDWFKARYPESSPAYYYETTDPKESGSGKVFWYQSPFYRLGLKSENGQSKIIDIRVYNRNIYEDYFATPNQTQDLFLEIPAAIDSIKYPGTELELGIDLGKAKTVHSKQFDLWQVSFEIDGKKLILDPDKITFSGFSSPSISAKDIVIKEKPMATVWVPKPYTPYQNTTFLTWFFGLLIAFSLVFWFRKIRKSGKPKLHAYLIGGIVLSLLSVLTVFRNGFLYPFGMGFWGPNGHDALFHLSIIQKFVNHPFNLLHPQIAEEKLANYHFLFDWFSSLVVKLSGISALDLYFRVFPILAVIITVLLLDKLLISWKFTKLQRLLSIILAFLAGSFGFITTFFTGQNIFIGESAFWSNQSVSIFLNPPFALSIIFLLWFLTLMPDYSAHPQSRTLFFFLSLIGGLLAQTKIYAFILLLGALLFSKKYKLFIGVLVIGILISLPFTSLGTSSPFIFSPLWFPKSLFASQDRFYWPRLVQAWQAYEASGSILKLALVNLFALTVFILGNLGVRLLGLIHLCFSKSSFESERIVRWLVFFGLLLPLLFVQNINPWNTIQFMYYSLFFLAIFTARYISKYHLSLVVVLLTISLVTTVGTLKDYIGYFSASRLSYTELLALDKLKDQPKGIVLSPMFNSVSSRQIYAPKPLYSYISTAYISALSGQPEFLSDTINLDITGYNYQNRARDIQRFYNTEDKQWAVSFLEDNHIQYVYETQAQKIKLNPKDLKLKNIFDSGEINIYTRE